MSFYTPLNMERVKLHEGSTFHKNTFARRQFCTKGQCSTEGHFCTKIKIKFIYKKQKKNLKDIFFLIKNK